MEHVLIHIRSEVRLVVVICLNGPAARFGAVGDEIIIVSYVSIPEESIKNYMPKIVLVDKNNNITKIL